MTDKLPNPHEPLTVMPVMRIEQLSFAYGDVPVLQDINLNLRAGRIAVMLGPNAAGKSTLLRLMLGRLTPRAGQVLLSKRPIHNYAAHERARQLAYVAQRPDSGFRFTVEQIVDMGRHAVGRSRSIVHEAMALFEIEHLSGRSFLELSVGQQQRVVFARAVCQLADGPGQALAPRPESVMLLDEPTSAMDLRHAHSVFRWLRQWTRQGGTAAVVVHDINLAAAYADDVWLLQEGRIVAAGPYEEVLKAERLSKVYEVAIENRAQTGEERPLFVVHESGQATIAAETLP